MKYLFAVAIFICSSALAQANSSNDAANAIYLAIKGTKMIDGNPIVIVSPMSEFDINSIVNGTLFPHGVRSKKATIAIQTGGNHTLVYELTGTKVVYARELRKSYFSADGTFNADTFFADAYPLAPSPKSFVSHSTPSRAIQKGTHCTSRTSSTGSSITCTTDGRLTYRQTCTVHSDYSVTCDSQTY